MIKVNSVYNIQGVDEFTLCNIDVISRWVSIAPNDLKSKDIEYDFLNVYINSGHNLDIFWNVSSLTEEFSIVGDKIKDYKIKEIYEDKNPEYFL